MPGLAGWSRPGEFGYSGAGKVFAAINMFGLKAGIGGQLVKGRSGSRRTAIGFFEVCFEGTVCGFRLYEIKYTPAVTVTSQLIIKLHKSCPSNISGAAL